MSPFGTTMVITISLSVFVAVLIVLLLAGLAVWLILAGRKKLLENKMLARKIEELQTKLVSAQVFPDSVQDTYRQFIYNISHDVSNPLQSVQINLENMADCSPEEVGRWNQYFKIIQQEIKRIFALTENLRLLSRLETPDRPIKREPVNLKGVVEDVIMAQIERASDENIMLEYQGPGRPARVLGDRDHLYQMIINLVDNSIKYSKEEGGRIIIAISEKDSYTAVTVSDNGIGVPTEDLPYIFDTAYRSPNQHSIRKAGSGLGLAIVKRIVEQHNGKIDVRSNLGEGTTVTVELPLYSPAYQE